MFWADPFGGSVVQQRWDGTESSCEVVASGYVHVGSIAGPAKGTEDAGAEDAQIENHAIATPQPLNSHSIATR